jgi:hypothetical protein
MIDILPTWSFDTNLKPSHVTDHVRQVLIRQQRRLYRRLLPAPFIVAFVDVMLAYSGLNAGGMPWAGLLFWEAVFLISLLATVWWLYTRQIRFLRDAAVTTAAVMDSKTLSLWGVRLYRKPLPENLRQAIEEEDLGDDADTLHLVTLHLRFVPGNLNENLDWSLLRDDVPHCDVTKRTAGGWGSFASDLKTGSLVSLLYDPQMPKHCRIVKLRNWQKHKSFDD